MELNAYETYKLNSLKDLEDGTQLWFNISNVLYKENDMWNFQCTGICTWEISEKDGEEILYLFKNKVDTSIKTLLEFIDIHEYSSEQYEYDFYTGYELELIKILLKEKLEYKETMETEIFSYKGKRFSIWRNYNHGIHIYKG